MKSKIGLLLFILLLMILAGCYRSQAHSKKENNCDTIKKYYADHQQQSIEIKCDGKLNGVAKYYDRDGSLDRSITYSNGIPNGQCLNYWKSGKVKREGYFKNGQLDSLYRIVNESGQIEVEQIYKNGTLVKQTYPVLNH